MFDTLAQSLTLPIKIGAVFAHEGETLLDQIQALDKFLASVEKRAFQMARMAVRDADEAMDIVQDAMIKLARNYANRPNDESRRAQQDIWMVAGIVCG